MRRIYEDDYIEVDERPEDRVVIVKRLDGPTSDSAALQSSYEAAFRAGQLGRGRGDWGLVLDMREVTGRNDAEFEQRGQALRRQAASLFKRVVVVVRTAAGKLQVARLSREDGARHAVATELDEAIRLARS